MKKAVRFIGFSVLGVFVLAIIAVGLLFLLGSRKINQSSYHVQGKAITVEADAENPCQG